MNRREFIALLGGAAAAGPRSAHGQQASRIYRIGLLGAGAPVGPLDERNKSFMSALAKRDFVEGRNLALEQRWANGRIDQLDRLAAELKAAKVDLIVTFGYPAALAAKEIGRASCRERV